MDIGVRVGPAIGARMYQLIELRRFSMRAGMPLRTSRFSTIGRFPLDRKQELMTLRGSVRKRS